jgi:cytoskeletal protein CcmA (bactofilin family)
MTLVGEEAYFSGLLAAKGSLRVEGVIEGDVTDAVTVEIGKKGRVKGNIAAESVSVAGAVEGDVIASRRIELLSQSRVRGNLRSPSLSVQEGAVFDGVCAMTSAERRSGKKDFEPESLQPVEEA